MKNVFFFKLLDIFFLACKQFVILSFSFLYLQLPRLLFFFFLTLFSAWVCRNCRVVNFRNAAQLQLVGTLSFQLEQCIFFIIILF